MEVPTEKPPIKTIEDGLREVDYIPVDTDLLLHALRPELCIGVGTNFIAFDSPLVVHNGTEIAIPDMHEDTGNILYMPIINNAIPKDAMVKILAESSRALGGNSKADVMADNLARTTDASYYAQTRNQGDVIEGRVAAHNSEFARGPRTVQFGDQELEITVDPINTILTVEGKPCGMIMRKAVGETPSEEEYPGLTDFLANTIGDYSLNNIIVDKQQGRGTIIDVEYFKPSS